MQRRDIKVNDPRDEKSGEEEREQKTNSD